MKESGTLAIAKCPLEKDILGMWYVASNDWRNVWRGSKSFRVDCFNIVQD